MHTDPNFCMNSYLMYRAIVDKNRRFSDSSEPWFYHNNAERKPICTSEELEAHLRNELKNVLQT